MAEAVFGFGVEEIHAGKHAADVIHRRWCAVGDAVSQIGRRQVRLCECGVRAASGGDRIGRKAKRSTGDSAKVVPQPKGAAHDGDVSGCTTPFPDFLSCRISVLRSLTSHQDAVCAVHNWMRKAQWMNDYREIEYGWELLLDVYGKTAAGDRFRAAVDSAHAGLSEEITKNFDSWLNSYRVNTYVTSISEHDDH